VSGAHQTGGKRNLQQRKREKAQAKVARKAARRAADADPTPVLVEAGEAELIQELADLHHQAEAGGVSAQEFEDRREHIRMQLEQIEALEQMKTDRGTDAQT
jgi:hypothetical protein